MSLHTSRGDALANRWFALGLSHLDAGRLEEAEKCYRALVELDPRHAKAHTNLGLVLQQLGKDEEALRCYRAALAADPDLAQPWFNLGTALMAREENTAAVEHLSKAVHLDSSRAEWRAALGAAYQRAGQPLEALAHLRAAIEVDRESASAHNDLGISLLGSGDTSGAVAAFRQAHRLDPTMQSASSNMLFAMNFLPETEPETLFRAHVEWARACADKRATFAYRNEAVAQGKLRVGYVSPDFRGHALPFFIEPILESHDRSRFQIVCYSDADVEDAVTHRLRKLDVCWRATARVSNSALAQQIVDDGVDILVDLAGHTAGGLRMPLFLSKPAPIQVSWLGYLNTTGLETMDYRITDRHAAPPGTEAYHTERLVRIPHSLWCYRAPVTAPRIASPPRLRRGVVTFGSFHNLAKVTPQVRRVWAQLMQRLPGSSLLIAAHGADALASNIKAQFAEYGVEGSRIECHGGKPLESYLALHNSVDICLDAFPYSGGTTTFHAIWMGVPVITLNGRNVVSRGGVSILSTLGLTDLVAQTEEQYVDIALRLATDEKRLSLLREGLRHLIARSPLMDEKSFTHNLENSYREMWQSWCSTQVT